MLNGTTLAESINAGTAAVINIYDGSVPANADASIGASNLLVQLTCSATAFSGYSDTGSAGRATFDTITGGTASATGTASYFRILTQSGGTVCCQGTVGTANADLILNTVSITNGSSVTISAATIDLPEGP